MPEPADILDKKPVTWTVFDQITNVLFDKPCAQPAPTLK